MTSSPLYNFRMAPEAIWFIVNTVIGAVLVDLLGRLAGMSALPSLDDLSAWGAAIAIAAVRTLIGAILAQATGGGFQKPGEPGPAPVEITTSTSADPPGIG